MKDIFIWMQAESSLLFKTDNWKTPPFQKDIKKSLKWTLPTHPMTPQIPLPASAQVACDAQKLSILFGQIQVGK